jgi:hypothetical protein
MRSRFYSSRSSRSIRIEQEKREYREDRSSSRPSLTICPFTSESHAKLIGVQETLLSVPLNEEPPETAPPVTDPLPDSKTDPIPIDADDAQIEHPKDDVFKKDLWSGRRSSRRGPTAALAGGANNGTSGTTQKTLFRVDGMATRICGMWDVWASTSV